MAKNVAAKKERLNEAPVIEEEDTKEVNESEEAVASDYKHLDLKERETDRDFRDEESTRYIADKDANKYSKYTGGEKDREVVCYECDNVHYTLSGATSSQCPSCGAYISLKDYDIVGLWNSSIRTRGDVLVQKKGSVRNISVFCNDLTIEGDFQASADCSNVVTVRVSGKLPGQIKCKRLVIEKKVEVEFERPVSAEFVQIDGVVKGDLTCSGQLSVSSKGALIGDIKAKFVNIQPGGDLTGSLEIG